MDGEPRLPPYNVAMRLVPLLAAVAACGEAPPALEAPSHGGAGLSEAAPTGAFVYAGALIAVHDPDTVGRRGELLCSVVRVAPDTALTAAHCLEAAAAGDELWVSF